MFLMGLPEEVVYFMCGALERTRASPTCCSRALTCFSTESQGPAVCRLPGRNGSTPHVGPLLNTRGTQAQPWSYAAAAGYTVSWQVGSAPGKGL